jgi:hypothetical protein
VWGTPEILKLASPIEDGIFSSAMREASEERITHRSPGRPPKKIKEPRRKTSCCGGACATASGSEVALRAWSFLSRLKAATP